MCKYVYHVSQTTRSIEDKLNTV